VSGKATTAALPLRGVAVEVGVAEGVGGSMGVVVGVEVADGVGVSVAVAVGVADGVGVSVAVAVGVADGVGVSVAVAVGVTDGVGVSVAVAVGVAVGVGVSVAVAVGVAVGVGVSVGAARQEPPVMVFVSIVTAPFCAKARPFKLAPLVSVMDVKARIFPMNDVPVPRVAELPTLHHTLHGSPSGTDTDEPTDVMSVEADLKIQGPDPMSIKVELNPKEVAQ